jgi:ATP-dependent Lon protease
MPGSGKLTLTGQLGEVMKESAQAAISYARSRAKDYNIDDKVFSNFDLHVHVPAGGIPKDGPSAGVTLLSSILSVFTNRPVNSKYVMTGELNLQGLILPIGGLKEKILAAQQYGFKSVFIPEANRKDLEDSSCSSLDLSGMELLFVRNVDELLAKVLL